MNCLLGKFPTRIWTFGTQKNVTVMSIEPLVNSGDTYVVACLEKETGEGFVILQPGRPDTNPGDRGVITFEPGRPMGGHWEFKKVESQG